MVGCEVIALQECEKVAGHAELLGSHELVGAVKATETSGWVHLYVRRGLKHEWLEMGAAVPGVVARISVERSEAEMERVVIGAVHLPVGDRVC